MPLAFVEKDTVLILPPSRSPQIREGKLTRAHNSPSLNSGRGWGGVIIFLEKPKLTRGFNPLDSK